MKLIDLSVYFEDNPMAENFPIKIEFFPHENMAKQMAERLGISITAFRDGMCMSHEDVTGQLHAGTHVDAPFHYGPICEGKPARTIDELPLEWFYQDGVRLDLRHIEDRTEITKQDIIDALDKIGYILKPLDIVLLWTGYDEHIYSPKYLKDQPGMSREATEYLIDQGIKVIGIDCFGFDRSFSCMAECYKQGTLKEMFPAHMVGRDKEYAHIEKLGNLGAIPCDYGFKVACFPTKVRGGTAGQARVVAIVED